MEKYLWENETLAKIVQMLTKEGSFTDVSKEILDMACECIGADMAAIYQLEYIGMSLMVEVDKRTDPKRELPKDLPLEALFGDSITVVNSADERAIYKEYLDRVGAACIFTAPIKINDDIAMYMVLATDENNPAEKAYDEMDIIFATNVSNVISALLSKKIMDDSLICSYNALQEVLNNVGCEVIVYDNQSGEVQFENRMARNNTKNRAVISEAVRWYFDNKKDDNGGEKTVIERYSSEDSAWYEIHFSQITWINNRRVSMCAVFDITQKKENIEKIRFQSENDFLTGLYNRMKCERDINDLIVGTALSGSKAYVLSIDLDDFKHINDLLGHQYGDELLKRLASEFRKIEEINDSIYRMGGDEFMILVKPAYVDKLGKVIDQIQDIFKFPFYLFDEECYTSMSMGVVEIPKNASAVVDIIKKADVAMYNAKQSGKNRVAFYDDDKSYSMGIKRFDVGNRMRKAVESQCQEFIIHYQPIVDYKTGKVSGCEALVRWNSKVLGLMNPSEFIPIAEYLGLIVYIGDFVFEEACRFCKRINDEYDPDFTISINLSLVQIMQVDLIDVLYEVFEKTKINPANVILEISESIAISDINKVNACIKNLKSLGVKVALDDFGAGLSSTNYIKNMDVDVIKIDKSIINESDEDDYELVYITLISDMCAKNKIKVCVEGIEKEEQLKRLEEVNVDFYQGFYYSIPLSDDDFLDKIMKKEQN